MLLEEETDAAWWETMEEEFGPFRRGGGRPGYAQIRQEAPGRMMIRADLAAGRPAPPQMVHDLLKDRRRLLVLRQEVARASSIEQALAFSCGCEGAEKMTDEELLER